MCSWEEIGKKWNSAQQIGWQAIQSAMEVGDDLLELKKKTPHGEWISNVTRVSRLKSNTAQQWASRLMRLALHRDMIEKHEPTSLRSAIALLPKVPKKTNDKQLKVHREELDKYEEFAKKTAKKQAEIMTSKKIKVELERLQNDAHDAVIAELNAAKKQLEKERKRISELMEETEEKRQFYQDLLNNRSNGYDFKDGLKVLRQAIHPDRESASTQVRAKAMDAINQLAQFLNV